MAIFKYRSIIKSVSARANGSKKLGIAWTPTSSQMPLYIDITIPASRVLKNYIAKQTLNTSKVMKKSISSSAIPKICRCEYTLYRIMERMSQNPSDKEKLKEFGEKFDEIIHHLKYWTKNDSRLLYKEKYPKLWKIIKKLKSECRRGLRHLWNGQRIGLYVAMELNREWCFRLINSNNPAALWKDVKKLGKYIVPPNIRDFVDDNPQQFWCTQSDLANSVRSQRGTPEELAEAIRYVFQIFVIFDYFLCLCLLFVF